MNVTEAVILAGGLGTRLRDAVPDLPKCMAPVNGEPFIGYSIQYLQSQGIERFIFALGYRSEDFIEYINRRLPEEQYQIVIEKSPLGTGGAVQLAATYARTEDLVVVNGDSIFKTDLARQSEFHFGHEAECTLALKPMQRVDRYGQVELNPDNTIKAFREKAYFEKGLINGGVYLLNRHAFFAKSLPEAFSFETDYLQRYCNEHNMYGVVSDAYFIDIGIPEDYQRAQTELKN